MSTSNTTAQYICFLNVAASSKAPQWVQLGTATTTASGWSVVASGVAEPRVLELLQLSAAKNYTLYFLLKSSHENLGKHLVVQNLDVQPDDSQGRAEAIFELLPQYQRVLLRYNGSLLLLPRSLL